MDDDNGILIQCIFSYFSEDLNEIRQEQDNVKSTSEMPPFGLEQTSSQKLLPDVLPSGDPTRFALPIFLKEPSDTFLIKSKPATLHCRVAHALRVFFQCNSENVEPSQKEDHVEPESGVRYTEASVDIDREQVEEYFSEFHCACVAISGKGSVVSRHALVTNACELHYIDVAVHEDVEVLNPTI